MYICIQYILMINLAKTKNKQFSVATDKSISSKLAQSKGGGRGR